MTCTIRIALALCLPLVALACESDPGDVGSGTNASNSDGGTESSGGGDSQTSATAGDDDNDSISTTSPTEGTDDGGETTLATASDDAGTGATEGTDDTASSTDDAGTETGTMVESCADCGPDEGCVAEVAFGTEYFCVPWPETCEVEFDCACASQFCMDPFTVCQDFPDPPQRAIACECPNC